MDRIHKITVENCKSIQIGTLQSTIRTLIDRDYPESSKEDIYNLTHQELERFTIDGQFFKYTAIKNKLGGHRWFFLCPKCERRVSKLFLPPEDSSLGNLYRCKKCYNLKNQSVVMGQNKIYRQVTIPMRRLNEIESKLERGHLSNVKIQELLDEYDKIEKNLRDSAEYRLYIFKQKHKITI